MLKGVCGWSWAALGAYVGGLGSLLVPLRAVLGRSRGLWAVLGRSWGFSRASCWRSRTVLGPLFGAMLAVLVRSWDLCWRSGPLLEPLLAVLGRLGLTNAEEHDYI